uniref:Uncharacterized protein n=1 Tax=Strigamia maritima TaxID=126957 RepID=T1JAA6_STRMM
MYGMLIEPIEIPLSLWKLNPNEKFRGKKKIQTKKNNQKNPQLHSTMFNMIHQLAIPLNACLRGGAVNPHPAVASKWTSRVVFQVGRLANVASTRPGRRLSGPASTNRGPNHQYVYILVVQIGVLPYELPVNVLSPFPTALPPQGICTKESMVKNDLKLAKFALIASIKAKSDRMMMVHYIPL